MDKKPNTIIITGAVGTIGKATAHALSLHGYDLLLVDRKEDELKKLSDQLKSSSWVSIDVTDPKKVETLFDTIANELVGIVLAAGIEGPVALFENCADSDFQTVMTTNVMSVWLGIKHGLRVLKPRKYGSIVVLSSVSGVTAMPMLSPYCASKHAVIGLVRTAAREAASYGVRVNAVCSGPVDSHMMDRIDVALNRANATHAIPLQRYATPDEVANAILFLCSEASGYCTGSTMMLDGGLTCR